MQLAQTKEEWEQFILKLKNKEQQFTESKEELACQLSVLVEERVLALSKEAGKKGKIGLLFSGGVDSTLIAFILHKNKISFEAVNIGFHDKEQKMPEDVEMAREIAKKIGFSHEEILLDFSSAEKIFTETVAALGEDLLNVINIGVGSVELAGIKALKEKGCTQIFGGLGSEEIFAGYKRHNDAENIHEECWKGLIAMFERDLLRDFALAKSEKIDFWIPFLDEELISFAMNIPDKFKLDETGAKLILREAAIHIGLPKKFARRPKRAAQYGSRTNNALDKLARQKGFKYKQDYIKFLWSTIQH